MTIPDIDLLLSDFEACKELERPEGCFYEMTGKYLSNYLYETIEYPGGQGGYQPINGVGISVSDFSYSAEVEVDLFSGFPHQLSEDIELFSDHKSLDILENLRRPWWSKNYTIWTHIDGNTRTGYSSNFIFATLHYFSIALSLFGWVLIGNRVWRKATKRAQNTGE